jgi:hypothetical protein
MMERLLDRFGRCPVGADAQPAHFEAGAAECGVFLEAHVFPPFIDIRYSVFGIQ